MMVQEAIHSTWTVIGTIKLLLKMGSLLPCSALLTQWIRHRSGSTFLSQFEIRRRWQILLLSWVLMIFLEHNKGES